MLRSMKLGLYLVLAIIGASIAGTVIPQQPMNGGGWLNDCFQLNDLYHSWWYTALLGLLTLNLLACSFYRLKTIRLSLGSSYRLLDKDQLARLKGSTTLTLSGKLIKIKEQITGILTRQRYEFWSVTLEGKCRIGAQKGRYGVLGSYITHFSFVVIIAGLLIGALFGYQGSIDAPVGTKFNLSSVPGIDSKAVKEDFQVRVDEFWIERYPNGASSGYFSRLTILENDQEKETATLQVNRPLNHEGTKFYQARYGNAVEIRVNGPGPGTVYQGWVKDSEHFKIPQSNYTVLARIDKGSGSASLDPVGDPNPKIIYALYQDKQRIAMGIADLGAVINLGQGKSSLTFNKAVPYTGLLVKKDPGVPLIWFGCVSMLLGLSISFFIQPRYLWMELEQQGEELLVSIGGKAAKNPLMLEESINKLAACIQTGGKLPQEEGQRNG